MAGVETYQVSAPVWLWSTQKGGWHFVTITDDAANAIRFDSMGMRGGFGSVKVAAEINGVEWTTSVFPNMSDYILPIKADVRRRAKVTAGDVVSITLRLA